ncbi:MAG: hypothetical protein LBI03_10255 [Clostridiales bacterium]|jgi:hypothetical protein|nr:hypothetical protein [Clostridiales bacterium]
MGTVFILLSAVAVIIGILLLALFPENPLFTLTVPIKIIICAALLLFFCLLPACRNHTGLFAAFVIIVLVLFSVVVGLFWVSSHYKKADQPQYTKTINISASGKSQGNILIVFHPGSSENATNAVTTFGEILADEGCNVEISTANPGLKPNFSHYDLVVLASNIYKSEVRPPIIEFVENNDLTGVSVFTLFVGNHRKRVQEELDWFMPYLKEANAVHIGHFKHAKNNPKVPISELTQCVRDVVELIN